MSQEITESWKDKTYEMKFTDDWFQAMEVLTMAQEMPTLENIKKAFAYVKRSANALIENNAYYKIFTNEIKPELYNIDIILYGNKQSPICIDVMRKYGIEAIYDPRRKTTTFINLQIILNQLWDVHRLTKTWAYRLGFFVRKPYDRKYGMDGISEGLQQ